MTSKLNGQEAMTSIIQKGKSFLKLLDSRLYHALKSDAEHYSQLNKVEAENEFVKLFIVCGHQVLVQYLEQDKVCILISTRFAGEVYDINTSYVSGNQSLARKHFENFSQDKAVQAFTMLLKSKVTHKIVHH